MARADIAVVVLNWNNAPDTLACLRSLSESSTPLDVVVVDNASADGSDHDIEASGLAATLIRNEANLGYAEGNNRGLRYALEAGYPIIAVLNNDTVCRRSTFAELARVIEASGGPVAVSPVINYFDRPDIPWFGGGEVRKGMPLHLSPDALDSADPDQLRPTPIVTGCCLAATAEVWRSVGLFDSRLFLTFEDSDWSERAAAAGVELVVHPRSVVLHKVSRSFDKGPMPYLGNYYFVRNGLIYHARHHRRWTLRFLAHWAVRPTIRATRADHPVGRLVFTWCAVLGALTGQRGAAPKPIERLASRWSSAGAGAPS